MLNFEHIHSALKRSDGLCRSTVKPARIRRRLCVFVRAHEMAPCAVSQSQRSFLWKPQNPDTVNTTI